MALTTLAGTVSGVRMNSSVTVNTTVNADSTYATPSASTSTTTKTTTTLRIDNRPAYMNVSINLTDGDKVTAAGNQRGEFEVIAICNHTTNTIYSLPEPPVIIGIIGLALTLLLAWIPVIGLVILGVGIWTLVDMLRKKKMINEAWNMVKNAPAPANK